MPRRTPIAPGTPTQTFYFRNVPQSIADRVRLEAARRRTTMEWVAVRAIQFGLSRLEGERLKPREGSK